MAQVNNKSSVYPAYIEVAIEGEPKELFKSVYFEYTDCPTSGNSYLLMSVPAKSIILACYVVVTTAFTSGGAATIEGGTFNGTTDNQSLFWDTTEGAIANFAARSIVGPHSPWHFTTTDGTDHEQKLIYDASARDIALTIGTASLTAGKGYLVVKYITITGRSRLS